MRSFAHVLSTVKRSLLCRSFSDHTSSDLVKKELFNDNSIVRLILNSPKKRNALSLELIKRLHVELELANKNEMSRAIILAAEGRVFSSGHDLRELRSEERLSKHKEIFECCTKMLTYIQNMDLPIIAEVNGVAAAAGCQLVATCDIVIAGNSSTFSTPGAKVGLFCSTPGIALARAVPRKIALDLLLTADSINAQEAHQIGLVSRIVEDSKVKDETMRIAEKISTLSRPVLTLGKKFFYTQIQLSTLDAYRMGEKVMVENLRLKDAQEGISAFIEKRSPIWTHTNEKAH